MTITPETSNELSLSIEKIISAPPEHVFNAWLDPITLARFMRPASGMEAPEITLDGTEGGEFEIIMKMPDGTPIPHTGKYLTVDPHRQITFTWESAFSPADSHVTLMLRPEGTGTHITLTHVKFFDTEKRDNHHGGWSQILDTLSEIL